MGRDGNHSTIARIGTLWEQLIDPSRKGTYEAEPQGGVGVVANESQRPACCLKGGQT